MRSPLLFGRKMRRDPPAWNGGAFALAPENPDVRLFGYTLLCGLVFFSTYLA
ncbi:MAG TPA: hypothetical protein VI381_08160 [Allosphingosinicella sp.]